MKFNNYLLVLFILLSTYSSLAQEPVYKAEISDIHNEPNNKYDYLFCKNLNK